MKKNIILISAVVVVIVGGVLVWYWYEPADEASSFFAKEDYRIEERDDGTYVDIERVGFTVKVPDGWIAEIQEDNFPGVGVEYWVRVTSADLDGYPEIGQGCGFSIGTTIDEEQNRKVRDEIKFVQENPKKFEELGYGFKYAGAGLVSGKPAFFWLSPDAEFGMRQLNGVTVPWGGEILLSVSSGIVSGYNEVCLPIWNEFLLSIIME